MTQPFMTPADQQELGTAEDEAKLQALLERMPSKFTLNYGVSTWPDPYQCPTDQYERMLLMIDEDLELLKNFYRDHHEEEINLEEHRLVDRRSAKLTAVRNKFWMLLKLRNEVLDRQ